MPIKKIDLKKIGSGNKFKVLNFSKFQKQAQKITRQIQLRSPKTFWVGGAVRDLLLGRESYDIDIATEATPKSVKRILLKMGLRFFDVGEKFGTIGAILPEKRITAAAAKTVKLTRKIEITTFRGEKGYADFRHPNKLKFISIPELDAKRRDLSINAIFFDPTTKRLIDYNGGLEDLKNKKIRFIGSAEKRITEDPLRVLRAIRFAAILDFNILPKDFAQIKKYAHLLKKVSGTRVKEELDKIMSSQNSVAGIKLLDKSGLLREIFPEIVRLKKARQSKDVHAEGDVFKHTLLALENLNNLFFKSTNQLSEAAASSHLALRYAVLFHDLGKFGTAKKIIKNGRMRISFYGHEKLGANVFKNIAKRIPFSKEDFKKINYLISHHISLYDIEAKKFSQKAFLNWAQKPYFPDLIKLLIADRLAATKKDLRGRKIKKDLSAWFRLLKKAEAWKSYKAPKIVSGNDVMKILKIKPGKKVGEILEKIFALQKSGKIKSRQQAITFLRSLDKLNA
jgi:tRNA nucleotidyltransferase/poly(A) polymerase